MSRLRTKAEMKPVIRATMNPAIDTWVRKWVDYYLYPEGHELFGRPDPEKQAKVRWFIRRGEEMIWRDNRQELFDEYGIKDSTGTLLPEDSPRQIKPLSFAFISASVYDNPYIESSYIAFLEGLPRVEKELLLHGNWNARPENSTYFQRSWCEEVPSYNPQDFVKVVRAWDFAATLRSDANPSPDYTVGTLMGKTKSGDYVVLDVQRMRVRFGEWEKVIFEAWQGDREKFRDVMTLIPLDPGVGAQMSTALLCRALAENGVLTEKMRASGRKLDRFRSFSAMCQQGGVKFLMGCGTDFENKVYDDNGFIYRELEAFDGERRRGESGHDDRLMSS